MKPLTKKQLEKLIEQSYYRHGSGVQINIIDISKIYKDVTAAYNAGRSVDEGMIDAIAKYRLPALA